MIPDGPTGREFPHACNIIHDFSYGVNPLDDEVRHKITRRRLAAKNESARSYSHARTLFDAVIQGNNVQNLQMLAFIFVEPFDLNIKKRIGIHHNTGFCMNIFGQIALISIFDFAPFMIKVTVDGINFQLPEISQTGELVFANFSVYQGR
jgi:hypothetical protein